MRYNQKCCVGLIEKDPEKELIYLRGILFAPAFLPVAWNSDGMAKALATQESWGDTKDKSQYRESGAEDGDIWVCSNFKVSHGLELQEIYTPILFKPLLLQANPILVINKTYLVQKLKKIQDLH